MMFDLKRAIKYGAALAFVLAAGAPGASYGQSFRLFNSGEVRVYEKESSITSVSPQAYFQVDKNALAEMRRSSTIEIMEVPLFKAGTDKVQLVDLELTEFSIFTPKSDIFVTTANGLEPGPSPSVKTYRGKVKGIADSRAYVALGINEVSGRISTPEGEFSIGYEIVGSALNAVIVDVQSLPSNMRSGHCSVPDDGSLAPFGIKPAPPASSNKSNVATPQAAQVAAELALECDYEMFQELGSEQAVIDWVTARIAAISTVYETEANCGLTVSHLNVYKVADPYPTVSGTYPLLDAFREYWRANKNGVQRTTAHLLSRQAFDNPNYSSGLAGLGVLCSKEWGYGVTRVWASPVFPTIDEGVIAHEIGHNFGANHTHNCQQWGTAIDSCVAAEDGSCFTTPKPTYGTIMSYCNDKSFSFGTRVSNFLKSVVESTECLVPLGTGGGGITTTTGAITISGVALNGFKDTTLAGYFKNTDIKTLGVKSALITGSDDFEIVSPTFPLAIGAKKNADLKIRYNANSEETQSALVTFQLEGNEAVAQLNLTGMTKQSGGGGNKPLTFSAGQNRIAWGEKKVGVASDTIITIFNNTPSSITTLQPKWDPTNPTGFTIVGQQLVTIGAGTSGQIKLRFNPPANKQYSAKLIIPYGVGQDTLQLSGTGSFNPNSDVASQEQLNIDLHATPNPFVTAIGLDLTVPNELMGKAMTVEIYNVLGVTSGTLFVGRITSNKMHLDWKPQGVEAGTYYVVARVDDAVLTRKIVYKH